MLDNALTFSRLRAGDSVRITIRGKKPRIVFVETNPKRNSTGTSFYIETSSGHVRPGHYAGGLLTLDSDEAVLFQPTMQQQVQWVQKLEKVEGPTRLSSLTTQLIKLGNRVPACRPSIRKVLKALSSPL